MVVVLCRAKFIRSIMYLFIYFSLVINLILICSCLNDNKLLPADIDEITLNITQLPPKFSSPKYFNEYYMSLYRNMKYNSNWRDVKNQDMEDKIMGIKFPTFYVTNYCGPDQNPGATDVMPGPFEDVDRCCKAHDHCPNYIDTPTKYSLYPDLPMKRQYFSKIQCKCDAEFVKCLRKVSSVSSNAIKILYSSVQSTCFEFEHPIVSCQKQTFGILFGNRCVLYGVDSTKPKIWQWFDIPFSNSDIDFFPKIVDVNKRK